MKRNNKGISLVEVVVTVAILAIVGSAVLGFVLTGSNQYKGGTSESNMQYEAQLAGNQLQELIVDASKGIGYKVGTSAGLIDKDSDLTNGPVNVDTNTIKKFYVYSQEEGNNIAYIITWNASEKKLYYSKCIYTLGGAITDDPKYLMANYVANFQADITKASSDKFVKIRLDFELNDKTYSSEYKIKLRNDILVNKEGDEVFNSNGPTFTTVNKVVVNKSSVTVLQGSTYTFSARVSGANFPSQDVTWSLDDSTKTDSTTSIDINTGTITLGPNEKSAGIRVYATSVANPAVSGAATVQTKYFDKITFAKESEINYRKYTAVAYLYGSYLENSDYAIDWIKTDGVTIRIIKAEDGANYRKYTVEITMSESLPLNSEVAITARATQYNKESEKLYYQLSKNPVDHVELVRTGAPIDNSDSSIVYRGENLKFSAKVYLTNGKVDEYAKIKWESIWSGEGSSDIQVGVSDSGTLDIPNDQTVRYDKKYDLIVRAYVEDEKTGKKVYAPELTYVVPKVGIRIVKPTTVNMSINLVKGKTASIGCEVTGVLNQAVAWETSDSKLIILDNTNPSTTIHLLNSAGSGDITLTAKLKTYTNYKSSIYIIPRTSNVYDKNNNTTGYYAPYVSELEGYTSKSTQLTYTDASGIVYEYKSYTSGSQKNWRVTIEGKQYTLSGYKWYQN